MVAQAGQSLTIPTGAAMEELGARLAAACTDRCRIYLQGDLGAGKTTCVRGFLRGVRYTGYVKSPTYTLVETYRIEDVVIHHIDLYRIHSPDELESIGAREYLDDAAIILVEWPERAGGRLPQPDIVIKIETVHPNRQTFITARTDAGEQILKRFTPMLDELVSSK
jgi:tRNA threonylcarbamoyladenosine biosynthesis protein TsaE